VSTLREKRLRVWEVRVFTGTGANGRVGEFGGGRIAARSDRVEGMLPTRRWRRPPLIAVIVEPVSCSRLRPLDARY
jgi:hypothetical protein